MEFETASQENQSSGLTSDQRFAAANKRVVLEPLHDDVAADAMSDEYIANQHILEAPIANVDCDTETTVGTAPCVIAQPTHTPHRIALSVSICVAALIAAAVVYSLFLRP